MTTEADLQAVLARLRSRIGMTSEVVVRRIEAGALEKFARATGQTDPLYTGEGATRTGSHGELIAAPTFLSVFGNDTLGDGLIVKDLPFDMFLHTDDAVEQKRPIRAGDEITAIARYADAYIREGRNGLLLFQIAEISLTNQDGDDVATIRVGSAAFNTGAGA